MHSDSSRPVRTPRSKSLRPLIEPLESRVLLTTSLYSLGFFASLTGGKTGTGGAPQSLIMTNSGDFYGTTTFGGAKGYGTIFKISGTDPTHTPIVLASFTGTNGILPRGGIVLDSSGNSYGTATGGGTSNRGVVWEFPTVNNTTNTISTVATFTGANGAYPSSGLIADTSGNLFGYTTGIIGSVKNRAVIFEVGAPNGSVGSIMPLSTF